jgi:hypothetical protein
MAFLANQVTRDNVTAVALWCGGVSVTEHDALEHSKTFPAINVPTSAGNQRAQECDYVVKRPDGSFMVVKPDVFDELFEPIA